VHNPELARRLRQLAAEPTHDAIDPWPAVQHRLQAARRRASQQPAQRRDHQRLRPLLAAATALVVAAVGLSAAAFLNRPQPVSAAEVLDQVQTEAVQAATDSASAAGVAACAPASASGPKTAVDGGGMVFVANGDAAQAPGPVTARAGAASELSDKLAQALGVSGDRVRQAMLEAIRPDLPAPPPDPIQAIAQQLGVSPQQVCAAFANPQTPGHTEVGMQVTRGANDGSQAPKGDAQRDAVMLDLNGTRIDLNNLDTSQLSGPAQTLGVSPDRLAQALRAAVPAPAQLPAKPSEDELISRLAQNLGLSQAQVRAAITQVEGSGPFYFAVPVPGWKR